LQVLVTKRSILFLVSILLSAGLNGCQQNNVKKHISSKRITIYQLRNASEPIIIGDSEEMRTINEAINGAKKEPGIVNMANPEFKIEFEKETYFLWISEDSGTIMNTKDTHAIYTLPKSSIKRVNELIARFQDTN
jgi:hypothetical protein